MIFSTGLLLCINWNIFIFKSSSSSSHLYLQFIFIGSGSSLDLDHHGTSPLDLDHLSIWINITGLDLDHHSIWIITTGSSSLDLDHHSIQIIASYHHWISIVTRFGSSLVLSHDSSHHRKFYRANPFSCWLQAQHPSRSSSTLISDPKLECLAQHLHMTMRGTHITPCQKGTPSTHIYVKKAQHSYPLA